MQHEEEQEQYEQEQSNYEQEIDHQEDQEDNFDDNQEEQEQQNLSQDHNDHPVNIDSSNKVEYQTPENENKERTNELSPVSKQSARKPKAFVGGKNFMEMNLKVKSKQEIQKEISEKKKQRMSQLSERKSQTSWMSSRFGTLDKEEQSTLQEWGKVAHRNTVLDRQTQQISYTKNMSKGLVANEGDSAANNLGALYAQSKKEKSWHQTNASGINLLHSYKVLDMPAKSESDLVPQLLANVDLKQNLNLKSKMDNV